MRTYAKRMTDRQVNTKFARLLKIAFDRCENYNEVYAFVYRRFNDLYVHGHISLNQFQQVDLDLQKELNM